MIETLIAFTLLMNAERATPLKPDLVLTERAAIRAEYLCVNKQWSHDGWMTSFKGLKVKIAGENLARKFTSNEAAHKALMQSRLHRGNIVNPYHEKIGVAKGSCGVLVQLFSN
jgi:uncharacterized protein YkwD